jgi:integrase/recombinase XerD
MYGAASRSATPLPLDRNLIGAIMKLIQKSSPAARRTTGAPLSAAQPGRPKLTIEDAVKRYLTYRAMKGSTQQTLIDWTRYLNDFRRWAEARKIRLAAQIDANVLKGYQRFIFEYRKRDGAPLMTASRLAKLVPLRSWLRWLAKEEGGQNLADVIDLPAPDQMLPRHLLSAAQIERVLALPDVGTPHGLRDRAILEVLYATGIRRMELAHLELGDIDLTRGILRVRHGKGRKDRRIPMAARAKDWLLAYLERGRPALRGAAASLVLFPNAAGAPINLSSLSTLVSGYVRRSGFDEPGACHLFRHSLATLMLDGGADIRYIQVMLGHSQLSTTAVYTHVSTARLEQVYLASHPAARHAAGPSAPPQLPQGSGDAAGGLSWI